jgi:hypothetical protein
MTETITSMPIEELEALISEKKLMLEREIENNKPCSELNELYKQLKAIQIEVNLRKIFC